MKKEEVSFGVVASIKQSKLYRVFVKYTEPFWGVFYASNNNKKVHVNMAICTLLF
jgi:hypothetical protein